jgi:E3 Ubiquitin ligase
LHQGYALLVINFGSEATWLVALALLGAAVGIFLFFKGFRMLQYKRLILNTPFSKIRSASMGLVEVSGMPGGPQTISSAITGQPCFYYRARAWRFTESDKGGNWAQVIDESLFVPFFLEDSTGRVLVNPQGAELDVHKSFVDEIRTSSFEPGSVIPESIRNFVVRRGLLAGDKIRLEEQVIKPGFPLFVFGTLGDTPSLMPWKPMPQTNGLNVSIGTSLNPVSDSGHSANLKFNFKFKSTGQEIATKALGQMLSRLPGSKTVHWEVKGAPDGSPVVLPADAIERLKELGIPLPLSMIGKSVEPASGLTVDASWRVATATAEPAAAEAAPSIPATNQPQPEPDPRYDLHARVAISKGERGDPFTISSQSQREVVQALAWKSTLYIWASPIFTMVCIYFLIVYWAWM